MSHPRTGAAHIRVFPQDSPSPRVPPGSQSPPPAGDGPRADFTTLVADGASLERVLASWAALLVEARLPALGAPVILPFHRDAMRFAPGAIRVAVARLPRGISPAVAAALPGVLDRAGITGVIVEEGYYLEPAGLQPETGWTVRWRPSHIPRLTAPVRFRPHQEVVGAAFVRAGELDRRVALIDSGDLGADCQYSCEDHDFESEPAVDWLGHGTAVGSLIRLVARQTEIHCYRVFRQREVIAESGMLMNAISEAVSMVGCYAVVAILQRVVARPKRDGSRACAASSKTALSAVRRCR